MIQQHDVAQLASIKIEDAFGSCRFVPLDDPWEPGRVVARVVKVAPNCLTLESIRADLSSIAARLRRELSKPMRVEAMQ